MQELEKQILVSRQQVKILTLNKRKIKTINIENFRNSKLKIGFRN